MWCQTKRNFKLQIIFVAWTENPEFFCSGYSMLHVKLNLSQATEILLVRVLIGVSALTVNVTPIYILRFFQHRISTQVTDFNHKFLKIATPHNIVNSGPASRWSCAGAFHRFKNIIPRYWSAWCRNLSLNNYKLLFDLLTPHSSNFRFDCFISSLDKTTPDRDSSEKPDDGTPDDDMEDDDPERSCGDELKGSTCSTFKSRGFCEKYPAIRNKRCRKSCGACQG